MQERQEPRIYVIVREDLEMSPGKLSVQCMHAGEFVLEGARACAFPTSRVCEYDKDWVRGKITLKAKGLAQLMTAMDRAHEAGLPTYMQVDLGRTEIAPGTPTAVGVGPCYRDDLPNPVKRLRNI